MHPKHAVSGLILAVAAASSAQAQVTMTFPKLLVINKCLRSKIATPNYIAAWLDGYYNAKRNNRIIATEDLHKNVSKLQTYCYDEEEFQSPGHEGN